ncbi:MAG: DUF362 domain-containing protein, partial [Candidatus Lokiarchaeota archaeon]|nr:DUF362 domain-containing protein [Candidatus Lokiarchaeota archaeon]
DYAYIATGSTGKIIVGDAPQMNANIEEIYKFTKLPNLIQFLQKRKIPVRLIDFRLETIEIKGGVWAGRDKRKGTEVFTIVDLKSDSFLYELEKEKEGNFYGADYNRKIVNYHHNKHRNEYCITTSLLDSDVVISVPKLKTHKKAGVTLNLKNFIGINSHKNYLPHYRIGSPTQKGDAFPNMNPFLNTLKSLKYIFRDWFLSRYDSRLGRFFHRIFNLRKYLEYIIIHAFFPKFKTYYLFLDDGDWCGNDTIWRTVLDLNIILKYANKKGELKDSEQRRLFSVIDGIIAGDKDGPLEPSQKKANIILMGKDLLAIDLVATKIMGFKYQEIPLLKNALTMKKFPISEENNLSKIIVVSNNSDLDNCKYDLIKKNLNFIPPTGWKLLRKN